MGLLDDFDKLTSQQNQPAAPKAGSLLESFDQLSARSIPRARSGPESIEASDQSWFAGTIGQLAGGTGEMYQKQAAFAERAVRGTAFDIPIGGGDNLSDLLFDYSTAIKTWRAEHPEYRP